MLFEEPTYNAATLSIYYPSAPIEVIEYKAANGDNEYWAHVRIGEANYNGDNGSAEGWVYNSDLQQFNALAYALPTAYVNDHKMHLNAIPTPDLPLGTYIRGAEVKILGRGTGNAIIWHHVLVDGKIGYMNSAYLTYDQKSSTDRVAVGDTAIICNATGDRVNLYSQPNAKAESLGTLYNGVEVHVAQVRPGFIDHKYKGKNGHFADEEPSWDGWVVVFAGESTSGFISGFAHTDDLDFNGTQTNPVSAIPIETAPRVMSVDLTTHFPETTNDSLRWLSPGDVYEILATRNADSDTELFLRYVSPDGDILTGYIAP